MYQPYMKITQRKSIYHCLTLIVTMECEEATKVQISTNNGIEENKNDISNDYEENKNHDLSEEVSEKSPTKLKSCLYGTAKVSNNFKYCDDV